MPDSRATPASSLAFVAALACALSFLAGCGHSQKCDFDDRPRDDVWTAVVQTARAPRYSDWIVVENDVNVDEASHRVTVYRDLRRDLVEPGLDPRREEEQWRFTAQVSNDSPVTITFSTPDWAVPSHFWRQADHFFGQVRMRLGEMGPVTPAPGDPMGTAAKPGQLDPKAPGHVPEKPAQGQLATP